MQRNSATDSIVWMEEDEPTKGLVLPKSPEDVSSGFFSDEKVFL